MNNRQNNTPAIEAIRLAFEESIDVKTAFMAQCAPSVASVATAMTKCFRNGGKIMFCGNGGSAADAQHLAAELLVRFRSTVDRPGLPAMALTMDPSSITACGNDFSFNDYYARVVKSLGKPGDMLVGITTSGKSLNILKALRTARNMQITTVGLLGGNGSTAVHDCDLAIVVPSTSTARIQECHITAGHVIVQLVEDSLLESGFIKRSSNT